MRTFLVNFIVEVDPKGPKLGIFQKFYFDKNTIIMYEIILSYGYTPDGLWDYNDYDNDYGIISDY